MRLRLQDKLGQIYLRLIFFLSELKIDLLSLESKIRNLAEQGTVSAHKYSIILLRHNVTLALGCRLIREMRCQNVGGFISSLMIWITGLPQHRENGEFGCSFY